MDDLIGWISAAVLCATISRQVYVQWKSKSIAGVSKWLFIGQLIASIGFIIYSFLLENWVFVVSNSFMMSAALLGQYFYWKNEQHAEGSDTQN